MTPPGHRPARIRVMLVDDHTIVLAGYARLLQTEDDIDVVGQHANADDAYAALQAEPDLADVLVLDLSMPGRGGIDLMRRLRQRCPALRLLVCTMHDSPAMVTQAQRAGATGFVTKSSDPALLASAIRRVAAGQPVLSPDVAAPPGTPAAAAPHEALSLREFEVLVHLVRGVPTDEIAAALRLAPKTVANLQTQIRAKLGVGSAMELLRYARDHGLPGA
jgi:DNA-binding NarL/FixJ family response regulator